MFYLKYPLVQLIIVPRKNNQTGNSITGIRAIELTVLHMIPQLTVKVTNY